MEIFYYEDEKYYYKNGKWLTSSMTTAPLAMVSKLNKLLIADNSLENKSMEELLAVVDGAKKSENIQLSAQALEYALRIATIPELRMILPRLTSNYRMLGKPQTAIDVASSYISEYDKQVCSSALFTSLAAAYCDIDDYETGKKYANRAKAFGGDSSLELISVYKRIKQHNEQ